MRLKDKTAIVTGGAAGIGLAIAEAYVREGAKVVIADLSGAEAAAAKLGDKALGVHADVSDQASTEAMAKATIDRFGGIDVLVNNAGIFTGVNYTPMEQLTIDQWQKMMAVNVMGPWLCARAVSQAMRDGGGGRIINIGSVIQHVGVPFMLHYVASKGAVAAITRGMAREFGMTKAKILVNTISPGYTHSAKATENAEQHAQFEGVSQTMRLIERPQLPEDLAGAAVFLASEEGGYINGQNIAVDGGTHFGL